jgi:Holliday junction resolvase
MNLLRESQKADWLKSSTRQQRYPEEFSDFARWRYEHPGLDSRRFGLTVCDIDQVFFHDDKNAKEAYILLLEIKTHGKKEIDVHQHNIYSLLDAALRSATSNLISIRLWHRVEQRQIKYVGWHLLVMSHTRPDKSEWMLWDNRHYINEDQLVRMLRFETDPTTLHPLKTLATETSIEGTVELERLQAQWKQVIEQPPEDTKRTPVAAILRSPGTRPVAIEDGTIVLAFRYSIHKELMEKPKNKEIAERIISNFLGHPCHVRCVLESEHGHLAKAALELGADIIDEER